MCIYGANFLIIYLSQSFFCFEGSGLWMYRTIVSLSTSLMNHLLLNVVYNVLTFQSCQPESWAVLLSSTESAWKEKIELRLWARVIRFLSVIFNSRNEYEKGPGDDLFYFLVWFHQKDELFYTGVISLWCHTQV